MVSVAWRVRERATLCTRCNEEAPSHSETCKLHGHGNIDRFDKEVDIGEKKAGQGPAPTPMSEIRRTGTEAKSTGNFIAVANR